MPKYLKLLKQLVYRSAIRSYYFIKGANRYSQKFYQDILVNALNGNQQKSDISDHLSNIFYHTMEVKPELIVELGTRGGESTRVLLSVAALNNCKLLSIDIDDCSRVAVKDYEQYWHFIRNDDVHFGKYEFEPWCHTHNLTPMADAILIDTSHEFEHTYNEIIVWQKHLSPEGVMIFHDTNMGSGIYRHLDGSINFSPNNNRDTIEAIERFLDKKYDENSFFVDTAKGFLIKHYPYCNGLTILRKIL